jgi:hypothetical protein
MRKVLFLIALILFSFSFVLAQKIPLSYYTDKQYLGNKKWKWTKYSEPKYYLNDASELTDINANFVSSLDENFDFEVTKGLYSLKVKSNGTLQALYNNKGVSMRIVGFGFYNSETKQKIIKTGIALSNPVVDENRIYWSLPLDANYFIEYNSKYFRDVIEMPQAIKDFLKNNKPSGWNKQNTWIALIYDVNAINLNLVEFDSNKNIFLRDDKNNTMFLLPAKKVYHELHQSGLGDFNNEGREWQKKRIYYNGYYIEAIPVTALDSEQGKLIWNLTFNANVPQSDFDGDETNLGAIETTDPQIVLDGIMYGGGVSFSSVSISQGTTISEATLHLTYNYKCSALGNCHAVIYGVDEDDTQAWSSSYKMSDRTQTTASVAWDETGDFTANSIYATKDFNVTDIVQEIINRAGWQSDNNLSFVLEVSSFGRAQFFKVNTYDSTYPEASLEIIYESADPCNKTVNEDWVMVNETTICENKVISLGTGKLFMDDVSLLGLINSILSLNLISIKLSSQPQKYILIQDSNLSVS